MATCAACVTILSEPYIQCAQCAWDRTPVYLCLQCFAIGWEGGAHQNGHDYELIKDDLTLFSSNWTSAEELRLLDGVRLAGYSNWNEVALYVHTKSSAQCSKHYRRYYIDQPHVLLPKMEAPDVDYFHCPLPAKMFQGAGGRGARVNGDVNGGYSAPRGDFETDHDDLAELRIKEVDFTYCYDPLFFKLQVAALRVYRNVLKERRRRKLIVRRYGLIDPSINAAHTLQFEQSLGPAAFKSLRCLSQLVSPRLWDACLLGLQWERKLRGRVSVLQSYRALGLRSLEAADVYERLVARRKQSEAERHLLSDILRCIQDDGAQQLLVQRKNIVESLCDGVGAEKSVLPRKLAPPKDFSCFPGYERLSNAEKLLCGSIRIAPEVYLQYRQDLVAYSESHGVVRLSNARTLCRIDVNKTRQIYDLLVREGVIQGQGGNKG